MELISIVPVTSQSEGWVEFNVTKVTGEWLALATEEALTLLINAADSNGKDNEK